MKGCSSLKRAGILSALAILLLVTGLVPRSVSASGAVAMSGSFGAQRFEIPVGGTVRNSSIYVVAFNEGTEAVTFVVGYTAPSNVTLELSETQFVLGPAQSKEVLVAVSVGADAVPGSYEVTVSVKALGGGGGIELLGAAEQKASLTIVDGAGSVHVETVGSGGERLLTHVRLWKIIEGNEYEFAESYNGVLDAVVSPGSYVVKAFSMGVGLASQEFVIANRDQKGLTLTVEPIYFKSFDVVLQNVGTGEPGYAQVLYTIANVYQPVANASLDLVVTLDGATLETVPGILALSALKTGDTGERYSYVPGAGWNDGTYGCHLELYVDGRLYASSQEVALEVGDHAEESRLWIVWVILGILGAAGATMVTLLLLKKGHENPGRKA